MKIILIGADGQLGTDINEVFSEEEIIPLNYPDFDLTHSRKAEKQIKSRFPDVVINTAAFNKVDECEKNFSPAFELNCYAVRNLAQWCRDMNSILVHFSTDYVFDGQKSSPYKESDPPNPLSVYGVSKLCGEYFARNFTDKYILVRTCGLYGKAGCWGKGYNFVDAAISRAEKGEKLKVVDDQRITPTHTRELAEKVREIIKADETGLFHLTNEGECTWYDFAGEIFSQTGLNPEMEAVNSAAYGAAAERPKYSVLENEQARNKGISSMSHWKEALNDYLRIKGFIK